MSDGGSDKFRMRFPGTDVNWVKKPVQNDPTIHHLDPGLAIQEIF